MGWRDNRRRNICKKVMFAPEEWERARRVYERWSRHIPLYRGGEISPVRRSCGACR